MFEKKRGKRFLASVMALVMLLSLAPVGALATEGEGQPAENQPVAQTTVESKDQQAGVDTKDTNENTPTEPTGDSDSAEATKPEGGLDEGFSADTSNNDNGIMMHWNGPGNGGNNSANLDNRFYIAILQEENPESFIGNEPQAAVNAGFWFVGKSPSDDYTITGDTTNAFDNNYENYINKSAFRSHSKYQNLWESQNVEAIADPSGVDLDGIVTGIDANKIIKAYLVKNGKGSENVSDYKLIPYVVKHEKYVDNSSTGGWHIDCQVVKKESVKNISDFTKSVVTRAEQLPAGIENTGYTFPENESVTFSESTTSVTLLYKLTVTGAKDANFTITDESATLVSGSLTGTIPEAGNVDVYVSCTFSANDIKNGYLVNTATIAPNNDNLTKVDDGKDEATANTPATKPETPTPTEPTKAVDAKYFVLMPRKGTPTSGEDQGPKNYFPNNSDNGGVTGCDAGSGYAGKISASVITEHEKADTKTGYFVAAGVESKYLSVPSNLGYFNSNPAYTGTFPDTLDTGFTMQGKQIVWYVIKNEGTKSKPDYHVDGYLAGIPVELRYHENFNFSGTDNNADLVETVTTKENTDLLSGDTVTISGISEDITAKHPGWTFVGWTENRDGSGTSYKANAPKVMMDSCELYAKWEKNYTVNFSGNGGVWDSSVSGYTMTTDENSKNIKATKTITVTPTTESTATVSKIATNPTKANHNFLGWSTTTDGECITDWTSVKLSQLADNSGQVTFYAQWKSNEPLSTTAKYTVNHYKWDVANKKYLLDVSEELKDNVAKEVTATAKTYPDYTLNTQASTLTGTVTADNKLTLNLYYDIDKIGGGENKDQPDRTPDRYQVTINYVSSNTNWGSVNRSKEVITLINKESGKWLETGTVTAPGCTATSAGGRCYFVNWTKKQEGSTASATVIPSANLPEQRIENAKGGDVYTFTANFDRSSGGSGGGSRPTVTIPDDVPTGLNGTDHYAYIIGYGNNDVRPQNNITRAEVATIFFRLLTDETRTANMTKSNSYNDVKDGDWFCCAVSTLSKMGIIKGYEDGSFKPNAPISRAEFAAIAARFDPDGDKTPATFADVTSHWAKDEISIAANHGWIKGYEDGSFKPDQKITRAETMTLVNRVLNRLPETKDDLHKDMKTWVDNMDETAWYYLAVQEATNSHYFKNKTSTKFEQWTDLRDTRDWSELEK